MKLNSLIIAILVVAIIFGGILASSSLGWWSTVSRKQAAKFSEGEFAGQSDPADIRGSYSLQDIENNFGIPVDVMARAFNIQSADLKDFQMKELETIYANSPLEVGTSSVRLFVALYLGLPFDLSADIYLPGSAAEVLLTDATLSEDRLEYLAAHTIGADQNEPAPTEPTQIAETPTPAPTIHATQGSDRKVKGTTTFFDLVNWGVPQAAIESILGMAMPTDLTMKVKDFAVANGLTYDVLRPLLQEAVDGVQ